jgi:hypothetical protein
MFNYELPISNDLMDPSIFWEQRIISKIIKWRKVLKNLFMDFHFSKINRLDQSSKNNIIFQRIDRFQIFRWNISINIVILRGFIVQIEIPKTMKSFKKSTNVRNSQTMFQYEWPFLIFWWHFNLPKRMTCFDDVLNRRNFQGMFLYEWLSFNVIIDTTNFQKGRDIPINQ